MSSMDIVELTKMISESHISKYNQYYQDERYKKLTELIVLCSNLDNPRNFEQLVTQNPLEKLLNVHNTYCYKHFDDEDIMYARITISDEKMQILADTYKNVISRKSGMIESLMDNMIISKIYYISDDKLDIYSAMYEMMSMCDYYFGQSSSCNIEDIKLLPLDLYEKIRHIIIEFQGETNMNPLDNVYCSFNDLQLEIMIMINLATQYLKLIHIWCDYHRVKIHQLSSKLQRIYMRLLNNYIKLIFEIAFIKDI